MIKRVNLENIDPIAFINEQIWDSCDILRGDISVSDFNIILYLTVLRSRNVLPEIDVDEDFETVWNFPEIEQYQNNDLDEKAVIKLLAIIHQTFSEAISHLRPQTWTTLYSLFKEIDADLLKENLGIIFEEQLNRLTKLQGKASGQYNLPTEISKFLIDIANLPDTCTVYNPFAGTGSLGLYLTENQYYLAQEHNLVTYTIALLRAIAHNRLQRTYVFNQNSLKEWGFKSLDNKPETKGFFDKFDLVFATPPFNAPLKGIEGEYGQIRTLEQFSIENGLNVLKSTGKLIAIVSPGFLSSSSVPEQRLREHLVRSDLLDTVILCPGGLLSHTSIRFAIIVINKEKKKKGVYRFIDAGKYVINISRQERKLNTEKLIDVFKGEEDSDISRKVILKNLEDSDFSFNPSRYLLTQIFETDSTVKPLSEVVKVRVRESSIKQGTKGRFIRIRDLKSDITNLILNPLDIEYTEIPGSAMEIMNATLLLALRHGKLRPSLINGSNERIFISNDILALHVYEDIIDPAYLLTELDSDYVKRQVEAYSYGSSIQTISKRDVLNLKIRVPDKEEQRARVHRIREEILRSKHRELELTREILGLKDDSFREFASIKHTLSQYLNALRSNVSGTIKFISKNQVEGLSLATMYSENLNQNFGDHLHSLLQTIDSMARLLHSGEEPIFPQGQKTIEMEMDLEKLVQNAQSRFKNPEIFLFEELYIDKESFTFDGEAFIAPYINILADDFYRVFSNIVANAVNHGFKGRTNNIIRITMTHDWENGKLVLEISNNGHPLPEEFTLKHLTTRGEKASNSEGLGIGGADIKDILDKYSATVDLRNEPEQEFPVTYILNFNLSVTVL